MPVEMETAFGKIVHSYETTSHKLLGGIVRWIGAMTMNETPNSQRTPEQIQADYDDIGMLRRTFDVERREMAQRVMEQDQQIDALIVSVDEVAGLAAQLEDSIGALLVSNQKAQNLAAQVEELRKERDELYRIVQANRTVFENKNDALRKALAEAEALVSMAVPMLAGDVNARSWRVRAEALLATEPEEKQ